MKVRGLDNALEDLKENLTRASAINDAIGSAQSLNNEAIQPLAEQVQKRQAELGDDEVFESRLKADALASIKSKLVHGFNFLDYVLNDKSGFDPDKHYKLNRSRFYGTLTLAFDVDELKKYGITSEECAACKDKQTMQRVMILASVINAMENKYLNADKENYDAENMAAFNATNISDEQQYHLINLAKSKRAPFTRQDKRFASHLGELIQIVDNTIANRKELLNNWLLTSALPEKIKLVAADLIEEVKFGSHQMTNDEKEYTLDVINDFVTTPNEEHRLALSQVSNLLSSKNQGENASLQNVVHSLFALSVPFVRSAKGGSMFGQDEKKSEDQQPSNTPPDTPRVD